MGRWFDDEDEDEAAAPAVTCWLCERVMGETVELHHPVPKAKKGKGTVPVHPICHRTIHANVSNGQLLRMDGSRDALLQVEEIARFVAWVADKPADFHAPTHRKR